MNLPITDKDQSISDIISKPKLVPIKSSDKTRFADKAQHFNKASDEAIRKSVSRLNKNNEALVSLFDIGLSAKTIEYFRIGISDSYTDTNNVIHSDALIFPIRSSEGVFTTPNAYYAVKNITINPISGYWIKGDSRCNYNTARTKNHCLLFICDSHKDMWLIHQEIQGSDLAEKMLLITVTQNSIIPNEIAANPNYFDGFSKVFMGHKNDDTGNSLSIKWYDVAGPKSYRAYPSVKKQINSGWIEFFNNGGCVREFSSVLSNANPISLDIINKTPASVFDYQANKFYSFDPVDISGAFHKGFLYYPIVAHETILNTESESIQHEKTTVIMRSDKKLLKYRELPTSSKHDARIFALSDGTVIDGPPRVASNPSWKFDQAEAWINGKFKPRSIDLILRDILSLIKSRVWLPYSEDYSILVLTAVVTYLQESFDAVPLLLMEGAAGTGKTDTTEVMSNLSCNGVTVSESSAATITRTIEAARGFIAIDDIEKIAKNVSGKNAASADDIIQVLKTSYKKSSAKRNVTDPKTMTVHSLNYYGVKMMSNTSGIDAILGTRTLKIHTRKAPTGKFKSKEFDPIKAKQLRYELHAWTMENINAVHKSYLKLDRDDRLSEICAPLRAVANQAKSSIKNRYNQAIDKMIERRNGEDNTNRSPSDVANEALMRLVGLGYKSACLEQIVMEMSLLVPLDYQKEYSTDIPEWRDHQWLRRSLQQMNLITSSGKKFRPYGNSTSRLYMFTNDAFENFEVIKNSLPDEQDDQKSIDGDGRKFCKRNTRCHICRYNGLDCDIRVKAKRN